MGILGTLFLIWAGVSIVAALSGKFDDYPND